MNDQPQPTEAPVPVLPWTPATGELIDLALQEDLGRGDVTTEVMGALPGQASGEILCREPVVVCGLPVASWVIQAAGEEIDLLTEAQEGQRLEAGGVLARLEGPADAILRVERTMLNFLGRMCGVATLTRRYMDAVAGTEVRITDTRKTLPGWRGLDKYAVRAGGGFNHRQDLGSGILIKDNHLVACGSITAAVQRARSEGPHPLRVEVEVETLAGAQEAAAAGAEVLLLDNMSPAQVREVIEALEPTLLVEVSGGINLDTVRDYAEAGAQIISVGALTHSARAVDLSLELGTRNQEC